MSMSIFELAKKLSDITNKPVDSFLDKNENIQEDEQAKEEYLEVEQHISTSKHSNDIVQAEHTVEHIHDTTTETSCQSGTSFICQEYVIRFGGEISKNGKIINFKNNMSRKEYLKMTKNITQKELLEHPLLFVLFRSEEQNCPFFHDWVSSFPG